MSLISKTPPSMTVITYIHQISGSDYLAIWPLEDVWKAGCEFGLDEDVTRARRLG